MSMQTLAIAGLVFVAILGLAWVFLYPLMSGEREAEKRRDSVARTEPVARAPSTRGLKTRREQVEGTLKEIEQRNKKSSKPPLNIRIAQAGLNWSKQRFMVTAGMLGVVVFALIAATDLGLVPALGFAFAASFGLPFWLLSFLKRRREMKFINAFPDAVDVIVRGIKSGLPLLDCLKIIATDASEPVKSEFRGIIETQAVGMPLGEACAKLYERIPLPEANFFGIVVHLQQRSGGSLSEALGNLSRVLRDRRKMKAKVQALSMEAKASAAIIGALPPAVMGLVYLTSPDYIALLWTDPLGRLMLAGCAVWMSLGILVMRKMINFDI
jgi:tight adherence protein B